MATMIMTPLYYSWDAMANWYHSSFCSYLLPKNSTDYVFYNVNHDGDAGAATGHFIDRFKKSMLNCVSQRDFLIWNCMHNPDRFSRVLDKLGSMPVNKELYKERLVEMRNEDAPKISTSLYTLRLTSPYFKETVRMCYNSKLDYRKSVLNELDISFIRYYMDALRMHCEYVTHRWDLLNTLSVDTLKWVHLMGNHGSFTQKEDGYNYDGKVFVYLYIPKFVKSTIKNYAIPLYSLWLKLFQREIDFKYMVVWRGNPEMWDDNTKEVNTIQHTERIQNGRIKDTVNITRNYTEDLMK